MASARAHQRRRGELLSDAHRHANDGGTWSPISTLSVPPPIPHTVRPSASPCTLLQLHYHFITLSLSFVPLNAPPAPPTFVKCIFAFEQQQHLLSERAAMFSSNDQITLLLFLPSRSAIGPFCFVFKGEGLHPLGHSRQQISRNDVSV